MSSLNKVFLIGRLGKDPEFKTLDSGTSVANFTLATSEKWGNDNKENTEWHNIVVWNKLANTVNRYMKKGCLIFIEGKITNKLWNDSEGIMHHKTEIVAKNIKFLDNKGSYNCVEKKANNDETSISDSINNETFDDDLPF